MVLLHQALFKLISKISTNSKFIHSFIQNIKSIIIIYSVVVVDIH
jgi:hypothetical protein